MNLPQLTFTRFLAAMVIVIYHFGIDLNRPVFPLNISLIQQILDGGNLGVSYFYVLSGFVMVVAYYASPISAGKYWLLRLARVYPVHVIVLLLMIIFLPDYTKNYLSFGSMSSQLTLTQAWFRAYRHSYNWPAWSLSVEIFFYFSFPFLLKIAQRVSFNFFALTVALIWLASMVFQFSFYADHYERLPLPLNHFNSFLVGMCFGLFFKQNQGFLNKISPKNLTLINSLGVMVVVAVAMIPQFEIRNFGLLAPVFGVFIVGFSLSKSGLVSWVSKPFCVLLGEISFSIYMIHWPLWVWWERSVGLHIATHTVNFWLYVLVLMSLAYFSFKFIENPARLWMKKKLASR